MTHPPLRAAACIALVASAGLAAVAATTASGQTTQAPVFRARTDVLAVDVAVVDERGEPITDLGKAEFSVTVDGVPRPVLTAEYVGFEEPAFVRAEDVEFAGEYFSSNEGTAGGRLIALVIDQGNLRLGFGRAVADEAVRLLDRLTPSDRVALVTIPAPGPVVEFTTDRDRLREGLSLVTGRGTALRGSYNISEAEALDFELGLDQQALQSVIARECTEFADNTEARDICIAMVRIEADGIARELRERSTRSISELRAVVRALGAIEGTKTLIFISEGLVTQDRYEEIADIGELAGAAQVTIHVVLIDAPRSDLTRRLPPTSPIRDRRLGVAGLEMIAGLSRGALFRDVGAGGASMERLSRELSGYYLLGVEPAADDRDGRNHRIEVEVSRRGAIVRARRQFRFSDETGTPAAPEARVAAVLAAPVSAVDVPMRLASYAFLDGDTPSVRIVAALEAGASMEAGTEHTIGFVLHGPDDEIIASGAERRSATDVAPGGRLSYSTAFLVDPGVYRLKMAIVDADGRVGSVEHVVRAWQMEGEAFAVGDLLLADTPVAGVVQPGVVARLDSGQLGAYTEMYAADPGTLQDLEVTIEIGDDPDGPALRRSLARVVPGAHDRRASAQAIVPVADLPSGSYVARAVFSAGDRTVGKLARPFLVPRGLTPVASTPAAAASTSAPPLAWPVPPRLRREDALAPPILGYFVDDIAQSLPAAQSALRSTFARAREGRLEGAALEALGAGDQVAAAFLRGLELFASGSIDEAAAQLRSTLQSGARLSAVWFYLGACHAAAGRDQQAAAFWRNMAIEDGSPPELHALVADLWLGLGDAAAALGPLEGAVSRWPEADGLRKRLGTAYAIAGRPSDALGVLDPYLHRVPDDHEVLGLAVQLLYGTHAAGAPVESPEADAARARRYATAYVRAGGPDAALITRWADAIAGGR